MAREINTSSLLNDANLQGYWRLENENDSSPNGYNLAANGSPSYASGKFNNGVDLESASSQYLSIADASCPNLEINTSQSYSAWIKPEAGSIGTDVKILAKNTTSNSAYRILTLSVDSQFQCYISGLTTNTSVLNNLVTFTEGNWYHVCLVYDSANSKLKAWVNGLKVEVTASGTPTDTNGDFAIGRDGGANRGYFDGIIDDVAIFNRALTDAEVTALYNDSVSPSLSPSASPSASISSSVSPSPSSSTSLSPSLSGSPSPSLSPSSSQSPSSSESRSISLSPSVSVSSSFSLSPSTSMSASISPSQPPGSGLYSKQSSVSLPATKNDLSIIYGEEDEDNVSTDDGVRVSIEGDNNYLIHQFKVINTNATDTIRARINLQSSLAPTTSPVYLQVWKVSSSQWETVDTDSTSPVNTDFDLEVFIDTNQENYYDTDYEVAFRVYQLRV